MLNSVYMNLALFVYYSFSHFTTVFATKYRGFVYTVYVSMLYILPLVLNLYT